MRKDYLCIKGRGVIVMNALKITRIEFEHDNQKCTISYWKNEIKDKEYVDVTCEDFSLEALEEAIRIFKQTRKEGK